MEKIKYLILLFLLSFFISPVQAIEYNLARTLMHTTFKIEGENEIIGTAFLVAERTATDLSKGKAILVTAAHVFNDMDGENVTIYIRRKNEDGSYSKEPFTIKIREKNTPLWTQHPEVDVAAMYVHIPSYATGEMSMIHLGFLADEKVFQEQDLHPGDDLMCLGYPLGIESNSGGFPVLRSGKIASYPLTPASQIKYFFYDFEVYAGHSGGPVFFEYTNRLIPRKNEIKLGNTITCIAGIVSQDISYEKDTQGYFERSIKKEPLGLAVVIPAEFIKQTIELLPAEE